MSDNDDDSESAPPGRRRRGVLWWVLGGLTAAVGVTLAIVMIVAGMGYTPAPAPLPAHDFSADPAQVPNPASGPIPIIGQAQGEPVSGGDVQTATQSQRTATPRRQVPDGPLQNNRVVIPALGVNAPVGTSSVVDGQLQIPSDVAQTTEWDGSAPIGSSGGTILVAGHVNNVNQGAGAFWPIHLAQAGDAVYLTRNGTVTRWKIVSVQSVHKSALPQSLFVGDAGPRRLELVTCGGRLEHTPSGLGYYEDNVIVTAVPF